METHILFCAQGAEVKPNFRLVEERTKAKIEAAEKFCESKGMGFSVWTEDHIFGKEVV